MKLVILDGSSDDFSVGRYVVALAERIGMDISHFALADLRIAPCLGDFECWVKTPGVCRTRDEAQEIARAMHGADLVVFLTPLVFGGFSADLKKAVDRLIGLVLPFFNERDGLTRHVARYERYAPLLFIGLTDQSDDESADIFRVLAAGNATNLLAPVFYTRLVSPGTSHWQQNIETALFAALAGAPGEAFAQPAADALALACAADRAEAGKPVPPRSAVVFIGSARPRGSSTSESLARTLIDGLERAGVSSTLVFASRFIKPGRAADEALDTMLSADLLIVAAPLYVDGLPSLVTRALERLSGRLASETHALRQVVGLLNCGYPEAVHNWIAMRMLRSFARQGGLVWAGGLALGGGEIIHGRPLASSRFMLRAPMRALSLAAHALAAGEPVPAEASRLMARPLVPARLFRWVARLRWIMQGRPNGVDQKQLCARPYEAV